MCDMAVRVSERTQLLVAIGYRQHLEADDFAAYSMILWLYMLTKIYLYTIAHQPG